MNLYRINAARQKDVYCVKSKKKTQLLCNFFLDMNIKTAFDRVLDKRRKMFKKEQKMI